MSEHISTLKLHQFRYGELDSSAVEGVKLHLDSCTSCRGRLQAQENHRSEFTLKPVPDALRGLERPSPMRRWLPAFGLGFAAVAAVAVAWIALPERVPVDQVEATRVKGQAPAIEVWVEESGSARPLGEGEALAEGRVVQVMFDPKEAAWVSLAGRDGTGVVEVYRTWQPEPGRLQPVPFSLTLDDAPGPQEFFLISHATKLPQEALLRRLKDGDDVVSVSISKE